MYYTSENKQELETYNQMVSESENYDGVSTVSWANIVEHQNGITYAILAHSKYPVELDIIDNLDGFFPEEI
jgi:hypothetical protein